MSELQHFGVKGMRWGVRKSPEQEARSAARKKARDDYREKVAKVAANKYAQGSDRKRAEYASQPAAARIAKTAATIMAQTLIKDALTGNLGRYKNMSKAQIAKKMAGIAATTAANVVVDDALAKSAMKNYTDKGTTVRGSKRSTKLVTKEDAIAIGINAGVSAARVGALVGGMKLSSVMKDRAANEARFNAWGQNVLPQKASEVLWTDGDMSVLDKVRR